ncbi:peptide deformylase, mitochondrial-like isoform X1 [Salvelinus namaycush]|uniref:Peptide deformylase n=1 Tax=Salvelinus namaycush TaxID=8040 RepID=A0A8U1ETF8_SALNM|nr:peptide deformylase, mitochondrial-like isoform X1 [Salvelinus namaycush]
MAPFHCLHWLGSPVSSVAPSRSLQASRWVTQCYESRLQWWTLGPEVQEVIRTMFPERMLDHSLPAAHEVRGLTTVPLRIFINHQLRVLDGRTVKFQEACESISGFSATVPHYLSVEVPGLNEKAEPVTWQVSGWPARILQHEMDHLDVVWYIDRMDSKTFNVKWAAQNE